MYNMEISIGSHKVRLEILILIVVVFWIMFGHILCSCSKIGFYEGLEMMSEKVNDMKKKAAVSKMNDRKEGFVGANNSAAGPEFSGAQAPGYFMKPSKWAMPTLTYSPGTTPDAGVKAIWDRPKQPIPLPEGELDMFATTEFKPECCPNAYSSSTGCACMTTTQYNYLRDRGGNNVPYSEY
jgi:hypothetical protein